MKFQSMLACTAAVLITGPASAAIIMRDVAVENASFEAVPVSDGQFVLGATTGWQQTVGTDGSVGIINPSAATMATVPDGENVAFLNSYFFDGIEERSGGLAQTLAEVVRNGTLYTMTVDVARRSDVPSVGSWVAELIAGNGVVATGTLTDNDVASGGYAPLSVSYTGTAATDGKNLQIRFRSIYDATSRTRTNQVNLDNVRLTAARDAALGAVPEPATWMMMIGGFAAVGASMRRRRARLPMSLV